jgi:putative transposase
MPRAARIVIPGIPHHITQRGNHQNKIFPSSNFRLEYLGILKKQCDRAGLIVHGYCLMDNHVHIVATPTTENSLPSAVGQAHHLYSKAYNLHKKVKGQIWEQRYYSCPLDDVHFPRTLFYVDNNPVRAGMVKSATEWPWSSAAVHGGGDDVAGLVDPEMWRELSKKLDWKELSKLKEQEDIVRNIRYHTRMGRPLGDDSFLDRIESQLGYPVRRPKPGRPRKNS